MSAQPLTPGRLVYLTYYRPLAAIARCRREGGPWEQWLTWKGRRAMMAAAQTLPSLRVPPADAHEVVFLTGARFWYQTAFCFWSLCCHSDRPLRAVLYDDGSLGDVHARTWTRIFPGTQFVFRPEIEALLERTLPFSRFPTLRARRLEYPNLRKLTDAHAGHRGWRLVLDSDQLVFRRPDRLLEWLTTPRQPLHMQDIHDAYGYPVELLDKVAGQRVPRRVNVGVCGLHSEMLDWDAIERACRRLQDEAGTSYYQEQALTAMLLARHPGECLPAADYRLMPDEQECRAPTAVLHHFVDLSKRGYFRYAWRHVAKETR